MLSVTADSTVTVDGYADAFADAAQPLRVLSGMRHGRGARRSASARGHRGAHATYRGRARAPFRRVNDLSGQGRHGGKPTRGSRAAAGLLEAAGLKPEVVSTGGTPDLWHASEVAVATEYRPGTYIYLDRFQVQEGVASLDDCALTVLATVVSRLTSTRAALDTGPKALTSDIPGLKGFGLIRELSRRSPVEPQRRARRRRRRAHRAEPCVPGIELVRHRCAGPR